MLTLAASVLQLFLRVIRLRLALCPFEVGDAHSAVPTNLLLMHLQRVAVVHIELAQSSALKSHITTVSTLGPQAKPGHNVELGTHRLRVIRRIHPRPIKQEPAAPDILSLALAESIHELFQRGGTLDLEEDLVVVVGDFDVQVFADGLFGLLGLGAWRRGGGGGVGHVWRVGWGGGIRVVWWWSLEV